MSAEIAPAAAPGPAGQPLDVLSLPLHGSRLIEASAGTGKTWTIAALYLRLVLGHGTPQSAPPQPLQPAEILVMTFTRAATRELSDRIRARLAEAARCFRAEAEAAPDDHVLQALLQAWPAGTPERQQAAFRLASAAEAMDDAAVCTIDAWCQRMLREHAFDSGSLFEEELVPDETLLREQAVRDHWRRAVYPLQDEALAALLAVWPTLDHLADEVRELLPQVERLAEGAAPLEPLPALLARHAAQLAELKAGWVERAAAMQRWLNDQFNGAKNPYSGTKLKPETAAKVLQALADWAADPVREQPDFPASSAALAPSLRLTPHGLEDALKKNCHAEPPLVFADYAALLQRLDEQPSRAIELRRHAVRAVAARMAELKARAGRYGFADLLQRLDQALAGPRGAVLRQRIVAQYPFALIDEFQDTSPLQYQLFDRLYQTAANDPARGLFLIGDPKQSIYGFRGADIYSYLQARAATQGRHYALGTNYRSTVGVVAAVNHLFQQAERACDQPGRGTGAFHFPTSGALQLPFELVAARGRPERFVTAAGDWPALTLAFEPEPLPAALLRARFAAYAAEQIVLLLNDAQAGFSGPAGWQRLRPADIAVLVRSRVEADVVRRALRERGVASVFLSDQDTVLASAEAADLLHWLRAVAEPRNARLARVAYAGGTFGLTLPELARIARDDEAWDRLQDQLVRLQVIWQRQGVLAMLRQTLHRLDLPARWLGSDSAAASGERRLTNVLHLAELLQSASLQLDGEQALIRWLTEQIADHAAGRSDSAEDRIVRLESDAGLVQVITVHKSKGLEYPLVFLPFAASTRPVDRRGRRHVERIDAQGRRTLDFRPDDAAIAAADRERLREELRLYYVALTRARHGLWLGVGLARSTGRGEPRTTLPRSALGHLLGATGALPAGTVCSAEQVEAALQRLQQDCADLQLRWLDSRPQRSRLRRDESLPPLQPAPDYRGDIDRDWTVGSFSALVRDLDGSAAPPPETVAPVRELVEPVGRLLGDVLREEAWREEGEPAELTDGALPGRAVAALLVGAAVPHRFPRGALPGNFLHEQLESLAGLGFDQAGSAEFLRLLQRRCERQGRAYRAEEVAAWLQQVMQTPLAPLGAPLAEVRRGLSEMEFWLPSAGLQAEALDALCRRHLLPGRPRPELPDRYLRGLLMGFADLVFEHGGRYWVLDYKSNTLGDHDGAYTAAALQQAVLQHRYELQAVLYQLALHRLLRARLGPAYDPATQLGGAIILFLRGVAGPAQGCVHLPADPALLAELDALLDASPAP